MKNLQKRKEELLKRLEGLRVGEKSNDVFEFIGGCKNKHTVLTNKDKFEKNELLPGQFVEVQHCLECEGCDHDLMLIMGKGPGCDNESGVYWMLRENHNEPVMGKIEKTHELLGTSVLLV